MSTLLSAFPSGRTREMRSAAMARWKKKSRENMCMKYGAYSRRGGFPTAVHRWTISPCSPAGVPSIERPNRSAFSSSSSEMSVSAICFASASVFGFLKLP